MTCECDVHDLGTLDFLMIVGEELERVLVPYYTRTGDTDNAALFGCLAAHASRLADELPGTPESLAHVLERIQKGMPK